MSENTVQLSRRKVLGALAAIGVGSAAVGMGTFAAFSDSETGSSSDNVLTTGDLDLQFNTNQSGQLSLTSSDIRPGDAGTEVVTLQNAGSISGALGVTLDSITNTDVSTPEAESSVSDGGRLSDALQMRMWLEPAGDSDSNTSIDGDSDEVILLSDGSAVTGNNATSGEKDKDTADKFYDSEASSPSAVTWDSSDGLPTLAGGENYNLIFDWSLPENADNLADISDINAVMADKSTFNFTFTLTGT